MQCGQTIQARARFGHDDAVTYGAVSGAGEERYRSASKAIDAGWPQPKSCRATDRKRVDQTGIILLGKLKMLVVVSVFERRLHVRRDLQGVESASAVATSRRGSPISVAADGGLVRTEAKIALLDHSARRYAAKESADDRPCMVRLSSRVRLRREGRGQLTRGHVPAAVCVLCAATIPSAVIEHMSVEPL